MRTKTSGGITLNSMTALTAHLRRCRECRTAMKGDASEWICHEGKILTLEAAKHFSSLVRLHTAARDHDGHVVYACPNLMKHGQGYSMTAQPLVVMAFQDKLF